MVAGQDRMVQLVLHFNFESENKVSGVEILSQLQLAIKALRNLNAKLLDPLRQV